MTVIMPEEQEPQTEVDRLAMLLYHTLWNLGCMGVSPSFYGQANEEEKDFWRDLSCQILKKYNFKKEEK